MSLLFNFYGIILNFSILVSNINDWEYYNEANKYYKELREKMNWIPARQTCQNICPGSGDLASIKDENATNFMKNKLSLYYSVWIGGEKKDGKWSWTDGTNFDYENWASSRPYFVPSNGYSHYGSFFIMMSSGSSRTWYDKLNGYSYGALCQCM